ncbi:hypothetical protein KIL84_010501 [Mauremys mutica]|uniref:Uncharacterized protein n=1 Tax=Mauremys mutica TaxID=74926 RepID=A0A9D3X7M9_9SAUR|nr:hypothetical protein KIL84_010501 [Mauremys mutica]
MLVELVENEGLERKRLKTAQDNQLDRAVFTRFTQECSEGTLISGDIMRKQAEKLKKDLYFRCSGKDFLHIKKLNLLDVFNLGETAWLGITLSMIEKCWHRGLKSAFVTESDNNQDEEEDEDENNFEGFTEEEAMEAE